MKKRIALIAAALCLLLSLTGCGKLKELNESIITLKDNGSIEVVMYESFDKSYYSEDELMNAVNAEVTAYNGQYGDGKIKVGDHKLENGVMMLEMTFKDVETYNNYMPEKIYVGTLGSCVSAGYDLNRSLVVVGKDGKTVGKEKLADMSSKKVIIVSEGVNVRCPSKVTYYSQGMEYVDKQTVKASTPGCYFVVYK